jgi:hypothetical protein
MGVPQLRKFGCPFTPHGHCPRPVLRDGRNSDHHEGRDPGVAEAGGDNRKADVHVFGQEVNAETFAICKADLFIKGDGSDADNVLFSNNLAVERHAGRVFDYMIANPPSEWAWKQMIR